MWQNMLKEYEVTLRSNPKDPTALEVSDVSVAIKLLRVNLILVLQFLFSEGSKGKSFQVDLYLVVFSMSFQKYIYLLTREFGIVVKDLGFNHWWSGQTL